MGGGRCSRLKGVREWLLRRVAAVPDLTLGQLQEELRVRGIRVGRMPLRRFLKESIIETGNERGGRRGGRARKGSAPLWQ
jgi:transposase